MSNEELRQSLSELRAELERLKAEEAAVRAKLDALIAGIETRLETPEDVAHHHSLVQDLRQSTLQLEVSHPKATAILNQIMAALGNMGT
jgi:ubiquinone biosynthesis protein COQ9